MNYQEFLKKHLERVQETIYLKQLDIKDIDFIIRTDPNLPLFELKTFSDNKLRFQAEIKAWERRKYIVMEELKEPLEVNTSLERSNHGKEKS